MTVNEILDAIKELKLLEVAELVKAMEEEFGVSAAAPVMVAAAGDAGAAAEEKSDFTVVLANAGAEKIKVIKVVREATGLGLKEAKDLVDAAPKMIKEVQGKTGAQTHIYLIENCIHCSRHRGLPIYQHPRHWIVHHQPFLPCCWPSLPFTLMDL